MRVKKVRRICGVKGCKNKENVYSLSTGREFGNSVVICKKCLEDALKEIKALEKPKNEDTLVTANSGGATLEGEDKIKVSVKAPSQSRKKKAGEVNA